MNFCILLPGFIFVNSLSHFIFIFMFSYLNRWKWIYILFTEPFENKWQTLVLNRLILYMLFCISCNSLLWNWWDWPRLLQELSLISFIWHYHVLFYCVCIPWFIYTLYVEGLFSYLEITQDNLPIDIFLLIFSYWKQ